MQMKIIRIVGTCRVNVPNQRTVKSSERIKTPLIYVHVYCIGRQLSAVCVNKVFGLMLR